MIQTMPYRPKPLRRWTPGFLAAALLAAVCLLNASTLAQFKSIGAGEGGLALVRFTGSQLNAEHTMAVGETVTLRNGPSWTLPENTRLLPFTGDMNGDQRDDLIAWGPDGITVLSYQPPQRGTEAIGFRLLARVNNGDQAGGWQVDTTRQTLHGIGDFDGDGRAELVMTGPNAIGLLSLDGGGLRSIAMHVNGKRLGGWIIDTQGNHIEGLGDFNADGRDDILITSGWGIGLLTLGNKGLTSITLKANGKRLGGWVIDTRGNHIEGLGDFNADGREDILITSGWGIGLLTLDNNALTSLMLRPKGTRFGGWLYDPRANPIRGVGDFDGNGRADFIITSGWGIGVLTLAGDTFNSLMLKPKGTRFGGWLYGVENEVGQIGDVDGNGHDDFVIRSGWGTGLLTLAGNTFDSLILRKNGTDFGRWILSREDQIPLVARLAGGNSDVLLFHRNGPAPAALETAPITSGSYPKVVAVNAPAAVIAGTPFDVTVVMEQPLQNPVNVSLTSNQPDRLSLPASISVPSGADSATLQVTAAPVSQATEVEIRAQLLLESGASGAAALVRIDPSQALPHVVDLALSAAEVYGTESISGTVVLDAPAPADGLMVNLSSTNTAAATVPQTVQVLPGSTQSGPFPVLGKPVSTPTTVTIMVPGAGSAAARDLVVLPYVPVQVTEFSIDPSEVEWGYPAHAVVTLNRPAPPDGALVSLDMNRWSISQDCIPNQAGADGPFVTLPPPVSVAGGATSIAFDIGTRQGKNGTMAQSNTCDISAFLTPDDTSQPTARLIVRPLTIQVNSLQLSPSTVQNKTLLTAQVILNRPAPTQATLELNLLGVGKNCTHGFGQNVDVADDCANFVMSNPAGFYNYCYSLDARITIPANENAGSGEVVWPSLVSQDLPRQNCTVQAQVIKNAWNYFINGQYDSSTVYSNRVTVTPPPPTLALQSFCFMGPVSCPPRIQLRRNSTDRGELRMQLSGAPPEVVVVNITGDKSGLTAPNSMQIGPNTSSSSASVWANSDASPGTRLLSASYGGVTISVEIEVIE